MRSDHHAKDEKHSFSKKTGSECLSLRTEFALPAQPRNFIPQTAEVMAKRDHRGVQWA